MMKTLLEKLLAEFEVIPDDVNSLNDMALKLYRIKDAVDSIRKEINACIIDAGGTENFSIVSSSLRKKTDWEGIITELGIEVPKEVYEAYTTETLVGASVREVKSKVKKPKVKIV